MTDKQTYWQTHLDAWRQSGLSQVSYCKQHGLSLSSFGYWLHRGIKSTSPTAAVPILVAKPPIETHLEVRLPNGWSVRLAANAQSLHVLLGKRGQNTFLKERKRGQNTFLQAKKGSEHFSPAPKGSEHFSRPASWSNFCHAA